MKIIGQNVERNEIPPELLELVPGYLRRREQDVLDLRSYVGSGNLSTIKMLAHKLKGNGSSYGFDRISELGSLIMQACDKNDLEKVSGLIDELHEDVKQQKILRNL